MPSRNETMRAFERRRLATPVCDDASLVKLEEDVAEYLREAERRDALARMGGAKEAEQVFGATPAV